MGGLMAISILYQLGQYGLETEQQTIVCAKKLLFMPSILFLDVNMPYSDGPWMHPTCSGHDVFTFCCRQSFALWWCMLQWHGREQKPLDGANAFFTQVLKIGQSIPVEMCPEQLKHFAEHVQFNWRAWGSAADSLFPQASWFLTHWGSIHSPLFPKRVSDEWSVELGELGVSPKPRCNHRLFYAPGPGWHCVGGWAARTRGWSLTRVPKGGLWCLKWRFTSGYGHFKGNMRKINHDQPSIER
jgi:hypothetical protein